MRQDGMLANAMVAIILQFINVSNITLYTFNIHVLYVNYISISWKKNTNFVRSSPS